MTPTTYALLTIGAIHFAGDLLHDHGWQRIGRCLGAVAFLAALFWIASEPLRQAPPHGRLDPLAPWERVQRHNIGWNR